MSQDGVAFTIALAYAPVSYVPDFWSASSQEYDRLGHEDMPWSGMPKAVVVASLDDTLGAVFDRAGDMLGLGPGSHSASESEDAGGLSSMLFHIGFYRPADEEGFNVQESYQWSDRLPVGDADGNVTSHQFQEVTCRQLLVSGHLGLIDGDVTRPYICPSMPQADVPSLIEAAHVSAEAAKAAYAAVEQLSGHVVAALPDSPRGAVDDAERLAFLWLLWRELKRRFAKKRKKKMKKQRKNAKRARGRRDR